MISRVRVLVVLAAFVPIAPVPVATEVAPQSSIRTLVPEITSVEGTAKAASELQEAFKSFQKGQIDECFDILQTAAKAQTNLPPARLMLARLFLAAKRIPQGRAHLEQAVSEKPEYPGTYLTFGQLALAEGRLADASLHIEKAVSLLGGETWSEELKRHVQIQAYAGRAMIAERRQDWKSAEAALSAWLKLEPKKGQARERLGRALFHLGRHDEAREQLEQAVKDDNALKPAAISMGWLYHRSGSKEKAAEWMEYALKAAPDDLQTRIAFATWTIAQDRLEEARKHAEHALELAPDSRPVKILLAQILMGLGRSSEAEPLLGELHHEAPADFLTGNLLTLCLSEQEDAAKRTRSLQLAEVNARQYPKSAEALATLGRVHYLLGNQPQASQAMQKAISNGQASPQTAYFVAALLEDQGDHKKAETLLRSALSSERGFILRRQATKLLDRITTDGSVDKKD